MTEHPVSAETLKLLEPIARNDADAMRLLGGWLYYRGLGDMKGAEQYRVEYVARVEQLRARA